MGVAGVVVGLEAGENPGGNAAMLPVHADLFLLLRGGHSAARRDGRVGFGWAADFAMPSVGRFGLGPGT